MLGVGGVGLAWLVLGLVLIVGGRRVLETPDAGPAMTVASRTGVALLLLTLVAGCDDAAVAQAPPLVPTATTSGPPEGWRWVSGHDGGLRLSLPPWLEAFDTRGAIFANEVPAGEGLQLLADGRPEPLPAFGEDLRTWMARRLVDVGTGEPVFREVLLPAGPALMLERIDRAGTTMAWRHRAWAIRTQTGVVFLWIDGPPGAWGPHLDDVERIPMFLQLTR
jgi:hypothetical protein